jgi:hypothetical protein
MMMRVSMTIILTLLLLIIAGPAISGEMAKEGSASLTTYFTDTFQVLAQGQDYIQINYDARGVNSTDDESSPYYGSSSQCVGSLKIIKGKFEEFGLCTATRSDKDKVFMSYEGTGGGGMAKGTFTLVGGTGKCEGLTGSGEWTRTSLQGPVDGAGASFSKSTYNWKLPEKK